jgi:hypothetical protein
MLPFAQINLTTTACFGLILRPSSELVFIKGFPEIEDKYLSHNFNWKVSDHPAHSPDLRLRYQRFPFVSAFK